MVVSARAAVGLEAAKALAVGIRKNPSVENSDVIV
jgi:hypothetical protein